MNLRLKLFLLIALGLTAILGTAVMVGAQPGAVKVYPGDGYRGVSAGTHINLTFPESMNRTSVETAFSMEPAAAGEFVWTDDDRGVQYRPHEPLLESTTYKLRLDARIRTSLGRALLTAPYDWSFDTGPDNASTRFGYGMPVAYETLYGGRRVPVQTGFARVTLDCALYEIDAPELVRLYGDLDFTQMPKIPLDGLALVRQWAHHVDASAGTGYIAMPRDIEAGLYVLDARHPRLGDAQTFVVLSNHTIVAKRGNEDRVAWVGAMPDGTPVAGSAVEILDADGTKIGAAVTNDDGVARFSGGDALFAVAQVGEETTLVGFDEYWVSRNYYYWWGGYVPEPVIYSAHIHTDRPIYRPGHTVHYKATLRHLESDGLSVIDASTPVTVTIRDTSGNVVATSTPDIDEYGSVAGNLLLDEDASLGNWRIEMKAGWQSFNGYFQVEEYVKPDFEVAIETDEPYYVRGDTAEVSVQADYYFGQPVNDAEVTLRVFRGYYYRGGGTPIQEFKGRTGPDGSYTATVRLETSSSYTEYTYFEAEVLDASRRPVVSDTGVPVHPAHFRLGLSNQRYGLEEGEAAEFTASAIDHDGQPVVGQDITVQVRQYRRNGYATIRTENVKTGDDGTAVVTIRDLELGWYNVLATAGDAAGNRLEAHSYAWIYSSYRPWYWWGSEIELSADRDAYAPGDTAKLLVKSPYTSTALITIERDEVYDEIVVPITGAATVDIPIKPEYAPNVTAKVQLWHEPADEFVQNEVQLSTAQLNLSVPATDKRLSVEITPDADTHEPGEVATFTVQVLDADGGPVEAQLSFALVDEAVLALATDRSGDIFDAFWGSRAHTVATFDTVAPSRSYGRYGMEDGERGGAPGAPAPSPTQAAADPGNDADDEASQATPRREFPDTAYWAARVLTDGDGKATITLKLPDSLTTWKGIARAITIDSKAGQGEGEMIVTKPIIADIALPRFAVQGDEFALDVLGRNYVAGETEAVCKLETPGLVQLDPGDKSMTLPFNETHYARWSVVASDIGEKPVTAWLDTPAGSDAIELPLDIQPFAVPERFAYSGSTDTSTDESFEVPFNAVPSDSNVEVRVAPGMALGVLDGLDDLIGYPYGCVEQTMSRMLPNAVIGRLLRVLEIEAPEITDQLPDMMAVGLQKLYGFQNPNGSWGWWHWQYSEGNVYTTSYVLQGLILTEAAGYDVDDDVMARGFAWLETALPAEKDARLQAYGVYVQSLAGEADPDVARYLYDQRAVLDLDAFALASLAVALSEIGRSDLSDVLLDELELMAVQSATTAHWPMDWSKERYRYYYWYSMANTEKNTAMALHALAKLRYDSPVAPKAARWLMEHRWGRGWRTTQGTAFAVLGLTDYIIASGELDSNYDWAVRLDGREVAAGTVNRDNVTDRIDPVVLTGDDLTPGAHTITLEKAGRGTLFYTVVGRLALYYDGFEPTTAEGLGIGVRREYQVVAGRGGEGGWSVGDVVNVRLTLTTNEELHYVIVEDMLPAGFEALNERLETETGRVPRDGYRWYWWGYERKELRDEKVTFFDSYLPPGTHVFDYAARVVTPGVFSARPAEAYTMYRPEVWGRSSSAQVLVATDRIVKRPPLDGDFDRDCRLTDFDASLVADSWGDEAEGAIDVYGVGGIRGTTADGSSSPDGSTPDGSGRDVNGDGRTDVTDIATAGGRSGLQCGDDVPLPPGDAGQMALHLTAPERIEQNQEFTIDVLVDGVGNIGGYELTLSLPRDSFEIVAVETGPRLPDARLLGPIVGADTVRLGGFAPVGTDGSGEQVLARISMRAIVSGDIEIGVEGAQVVTDEGGEYEVTANGVVVSPDPWTPRATLYMPVAKR